MSPSCRPLYSLRERSSYCVLLLPWLQVLDYGDFLELAHHILRGDQVIVRGSDVTTVTSILDVLKARK